MSSLLADYATVAGPGALEEIQALADRLRERRVLHVNSTAVGGGVAEILTRMVPLMNEVGLLANWWVIRGDNEFFSVTKSIHNALQGGPGALTAEMRTCYERTQAFNRDSMPRDTDVVIVHDAQPAGLVTAETRGHAKWIWRCHVDLSRPNASYWDYIAPIVARYDATVFSSPKFAQRTGLPTYIVPPSIDPLSQKNCELDRETVRRTLEQFSLDPKRPILTQVSRFDWFKDPLGVIQAYRIVKSDFNVQLVLAGGGADDDPEGSAVLARIREEASGDPDIHILALPPTANPEINALQRGSTIVLQKSTREGFGLTVTEALWKGKPVVAGAVGGITQQIKHNITGILVSSVEGTAYYVKYLLENPEFAASLGRNGREHVRQHFLLTRHLRDYLAMLLLLLSGRGGLVDLSGDGAP